jgi:multiple sugar transport system substrate-binding protein
MEKDQTVFQNSANFNQPVQPAVGNPVAPSIPPVALPSQSLVSNPLPPAENPSSPPPKRNLHLSAKFFRILIGLVVVLVIVAIVALTLFAFSNKKTNPEVTLNYWGLWEDSKTMQVVINDFQRQNPNIKIKYTKQDAKQYRDILVARKDNGKGPDIFVFHNTWYPMLTSMLLPFSKDTMTGKEFTDTFYPVMQKDLIKGGAIYGIPTGVDTLALYINKDIFSSAGIKPPTNWTEFIDDSRLLTVKDTDGKIKTAGAAMGAFDNVTHAPDIISLLFLQNSADLGNIDSSRDRIQGALTFYSSFVTDSANVWDSTLDPSLLAFSKGNLAMFFGYSWDYFTIKQFNPNLNFEIVPVPQLANQSVNIASYWASGVSASTLHQKEALRFLKFLAQKSTEQSLYLEESKGRAFGEPYARIDLSGSLKDNQIVYPFVSQAKTADSSYFVDSTNDNGLNQELNTYLGNAVNSIYNGTSVESAFDTFSQGVTQVLQKYGE